MFYKGSSCAYQQYCELLGTTGQVVAFCQFGCVAYSVCCYEESIYFYLVVCVQKQFLKCLLSCDFALLSRRGLSACFLSVCVLNVLLRQSNTYKSLLLVVCRLLRSLNLGSAHLS